MWPRGDRGAATVEGAIALCSMLAVFGLVLAGVTALSHQLRCADAATEAARHLARGQAPLADEAVRRLAPSGATIDARTQEATVAVTVAVPAIGGLLPGVAVRAEAFAELEPGEAEAEEVEEVMAGVEAPP
ncbi:TadE family type IV pilus minor pilin [Prauserella cavernicola]|uniref:Pilus assembly protein n=1 Tax=Prauserella cavernicola TaxID=2800127 RepID=A0A934QRX2_9PSEU|nr:TadE family type IV pilus minor pilin [Prauserella cavernicola]MBK1785162.1 pilus assembly protein [Prauserella cavernicola]